MSMQKVLMGVATVIAVGVGSLWAARDKKSVPPSPEEQRWPRATRLGTQLDHPSGVAADTQYLYFVTGGFQQAENAVKRVALTGGAVETLASGDFMTGGHIICDERFVYWTTQGSSMSVRAVPKAGGKAVILATAPARPDYLAVDDTHVYFTTTSKTAEVGQVLRVAKQGGNLDTLLKGYAGLSGLVVDQSFVYFTTPEGLHKVAKTGGSPTMMLAGERKAIRLAGDAQFLYFFSEESTGKLGIAKLAKSGGAPTRLTPPAQWTMDLALSDNAVYFFQETNSTYAGQITVYALRRVPKAGGEVATVDAGEVTSGRLTIAGGDVLFSDINTLYRVPK